VVAGNVNDPRILAGQQFQGSVQALPHGKIPSHDDDLSLRQHLVDQLATAILVELTVQSLQT